MHDRSATYTYKRHKRDRRLLAVERGIHLRNLSELGQWSGLLAAVEGSEGLSPGQGALEAFKERLIEHLLPIGRLLWLVEGGGGWRRDGCLATDAPRSPL